MPEAGPLPLEGVLVADFGQGVAGPYCAMLLAEHGADVVKIEPPRGDWGRGIGTRAFAGHTAVSVAMNRNKRSITLDMATADGVAVARELIARSRVVVENFRPDVMPRLGLGYEACAAGRKDLVYCSVNGFGPSGPYAELPAGDSITQPLAGLMSIIGGPGDPPMRVGNVVSDMLAGMNAFQGALLGLRQSDRTGSCQRVNVSLLESLLAFQAPTFTEHLMTGELPRRNGNDHPMIAPSGAFRTADGWVYFTVLEHRWQAFCTGLGRPELAREPSFADNTARIRNRAELSRRLAGEFEGRSTVECLALLRALDVPCSRINDYVQVLEDPQVRHCDVFYEVEHATLQKLPVVRTAVRLDGERIPYRHPPANGEDSLDVLQRTLQYPADRIAALIGSGAVRTAARS
jgi:crotonobetainyl-CoA:carnitine CoA-transferase CaiB-like acyl-CoA transferase